MTELRLVSIRRSDRRAIIVLLQASEEGSAAAQAGVAASPRKSSCLVITARIAWAVMTRGEDYRKPAVTAEPATT